MYKAVNYNFTNNYHQEREFYLAILLLDIENLYLDINTEKFLNTVCHYPIKLKFAFANWRNLGKKDVEFYERGYELLHVPPGKNSADLKMISFGSSIWLNYPKAKEVLICSSDGDLNHLSIALQHHGLTVYKVSRRGNELIVLNSQTSQIQRFTLAKITEYPSINECLNEVKNLLTTEQKRTGKVWIKLTRIIQLFKKNLNLNLPEVIEYYFPEQDLAEIILAANNGIVVYKPDNGKELYLTIFSDKTEEKCQEKDSNQIDSPVNLEMALIKIIRQLIQESKEEYVPISQVASEYQKKYQVSITKSMEKLQLGKKFAQLLKSYDSLEIKKQDNVYYVSLLT